MRIISSAPLLPCSALPPLQYHGGFRAQVEKWPVNPVSIMAQLLKSARPGTVVADFGCGEAELARTFANSQLVFHSFDLVARNEFITACDISKVPLADASVDVAIFCLSLMGTNFMDFLKEAKRVLRPSGILRIAEVSSRFDGLPAFTRAVEALGFVLRRQDTTNTHFVLFEFAVDQTQGREKRSHDSNGDKGEIADTPVRLKACKYKKR